MESKYDLWQARKRPPKVRRMGDTARAIADREITPDVPIAVLCEGHGVRELALFGSILREDFDPKSSDVDAVVVFGPARGESMARQYFDFKQSLEQLLGRPVDLVEIKAMPETRLKRIIERTKVLIYVAPA
jgi:predicted nucleotidyltransferase